ncbi:MAG: hypothetical protein JWM53_2341 [bacterium]|nr:hypothetical protein [bacterium]
MALFALVAGCGPHYWVWREARPSPSGWIAARRASDDAAVVLRPDQLREDASRADGARNVTRRFRNSNAFAAGLSLVGCGTVLAAVGVAFAAIAGEVVDNRGFNESVALGFGIPGTAMALAGAGLVWLGWPVTARVESPAAHPDVVDAPPPRR